MSAVYPLDGAVCDGVATADYDPFFPDTPEAEADALAMCSICPAREACLAYAVETRQVFGIWGGRTQREIRDLIAHASRVPAGARRVLPGHRNADKTHCAYGHPYDRANTPTTRPMVSAAVALAVPALLGRGGWLAASAGVSADASRPHPTAQPDRGRAAPYRGGGPGGRVRNRRLRAAHLPGAPRR